MKIHDLESKDGKLSSIYDYFRLNTILHASEIMDIRRMDRSHDLVQKVKNTGYCTADAVMYTIENKDVVLYFGGNNVSLIYNNMPQATNELSHNGNYNARWMDRERIKRLSKETNEVIRVPFSELKLKTSLGGQEEFHYFDIHTNDLYGKKLNASQRKLAKKVYGQFDPSAQTNHIDENYALNMKMLNDTGIESTQFFVLNQECVKKNMLEDQAIVRSCYLGDMIYLRSFFSTAACGDRTRRKGGQAGIGVKR